jgi:hypothetical protein
MLGAMRKILLTIVTAAAAVFMAAGTAFAGSPHFVGAPVASVSGDTVTVQAKEAGLGDEAQITAVLSGEAACVNPGGNQPQAANKTAFSQSFTEPVQNGHADYTLSVTAGPTDPPCQPPMTEVVVSATLTDATNGLTVALVP